jgi:hypothetical protein
MFDAVDDIMDDLIAAGNRRRAGDQHEGV